MCSTLLKGTNRDPCTTYVRTYVHTMCWLHFFFFFVWCSYVCVHNRCSCYGSGHLLETTRISRAHAMARNSSTATWPIVCGLHIWLPPRAVMPCIKVVYILLVFSFNSYFAGLRLEYFCYFFVVISATVLLCRVSLSSHCPNDAYGGGPIYDTTGVRVDARTRYQLHLYAAGNTICTRYINVAASTIYSYSHDEPPSVAAAFSPPHSKNDHSTNTHNSRLQAG